jgi:hypothetical protein
MSRYIPIRDQVGKIIDVRPKEAVDPVQATLDASLKAVGATPADEPTTTAPTPQRPAWHTYALAVAVLLIGVLAIVRFSLRTSAPSRPATIPHPSVTVVPTPHQTAVPSVVPNQNSHQVTLSPITLYGDYEETTRIGNAPSGITCVLAGQSPDGLWAYLTCPAPTNAVWAKVGDLELTAAQRDTFMDTRVISRSVPTTPAFSSPSAPLRTGPTLPFCADRGSIWGKTHQCAATQAEADSLADSDMGRINATAEAIQRNATK